MKETPDSPGVTPDQLRPFPLRESLGFLLVRTALRLRLLGNTILQEAGYDITVDQWGILNLLWEADGQTPVELARRAGKDKPNVTRLLKILEEKHLVSRRPDAQDRRSHRIFLTVAGTALKAPLLGLGTKCLEQACQGLSGQDVETLKALLNRVHANVH
jgi:MarR family transcriptional regulator for hemolysin